MVFRCVLGQIVGNPLPSAFFEEQVHGGRHPSDDKRYTIGMVLTSQGWLNWLHANEYESSDMTTLSLLKLIGIW